MTFQSDTKHHIIFGCMWLYSFISISLECRRRVKRGTNDKVNIKVEIWGIFMYRSACGGVWYGIMAHTAAIPMVEYRWEKGVQAMAKDKMSTCVLPTSSLYFSPCFCISVSVFLLPKHHLGHLNLILW